MPLAPPPLDTGIFAPYAADRWAGTDDREPVVHWQSLVDRRLIGAIPPPDPAVLASIRAAEAILLPRRTGAVW